VKEIEKNGKSDVFPIELAPGVAKLSIVRGSLAATMVLPNPIHMP
jgi:hypothetical protein